MPMARRLRVVLPTDELLCVECWPWSTVETLKASVADACVDKFRPDREGRMSSDLAPDWRSGKLVLVRENVDLDDKTQILDAVCDRDILELVLPSTATDPVQQTEDTWDDDNNAEEFPSPIFPESKFLQPDTELRPAETVSISTCSTSETSLIASSSSRHFSRGSLCYGIRLPSRARTRRAKRKVVVATSRRAAAASSPVFPILHGGLELVQRLLVVKDELRTLLLHLRDAELGGAAVTLEGLLPQVSRITTALCQTDGGAMVDRWHAANLNTPLAGNTLEAPPLSRFQDPACIPAVIRSLAQTIGGGAARSAVLMQGWVDATEWRGIWRDQHAAYACLCADHSLFLFSTRQQSADFVFELDRARDGHQSDASARILKGSAPRRQFDLSRDDWVVRRADGGDKQKPRHAFAFFDKMGTMRLILDVTTAREVEQWIRIICTELRLNELYTRIRDRDDSGIGASRSNTTLSEPVRTGVTFPLHWLHARVDKLSSSARSERRKSRSYSQALKDLRRDRLAINGVTYQGSKLEDVLVALTTKLLALLDRRQERNDKPVTPPSPRRGPSDSFPAEMNALCFARQLVVCCSRTHGGGDILDMLHLLFDREKYVVCPETRSMAPIRLQLDATNTTSSQLGAQISITMTYRVLPIDATGPYSSDRGHSNDGSSAHGRRVVAVYTQRLMGAALEWREADGSVHVEFER